MSRLRSSHPGLLAPAAAAAAAVSLGACGGGAARTTTSAAAPPVAVAGPALCGPIAVTATGRVRAAAATEISGLVRSPTRPGVLWAHNDSGDRPRIFALRTDGSEIASLDVPGAAAVDWEDMAVGPGDSLLLGDIGDNRSDRPSIDVYRIPEPELSSNPTVTAPAVRVRLRYPDGPHDAETLLADPRTGELVIVTKRLDGRSGVYATALPAGTAGGARTLRRTGTLRLGLGGLATGGSVSGDGRTVVVRTYTSFLVWTRRPGASLAATLRRTPCVGQTSLLREGQGESLALSRDGRSFFTIPEGVRPTVRRYVATR